MELDIRKETSAIDVIRVADRDSASNIIEVIKKSVSHERITLMDADSQVNLAIKGKAHALNVIKGIQAAIEMGWLK